MADKEINALPDGNAAFTHWLALDPANADPTQRNNLTQIRALFVASGIIDLSTAQALTNKKINAVTLIPATAAAGTGATTEVPTLPDGFELTLVKVGGYTGGYHKVRFTGPTDVTCPRIGLLATVARQPETDSGDTKASASTVDLTEVKSGQVDITGTTTINNFTLATGVEKVVRFTGIVSLVNSATLLLPTARNITTEANGYATLIGRSGGVVEVVDYQTSDKGKTMFDGDVRFMGDVYAAGSITLLGALATGGSVSFIGSPATIIRTPVAADSTLPSGVKTLASGIDNYDATSRAIVANTSTYIVGSNLVIPTSKMKVGTKFSWKFNIVKTAAGTGTSTIDIHIGTAGTTADASMLSFIKPAGTAAADEGFVMIEAVVQAITAGVACILGEMTVLHNLAATGHMTIPVACVHEESAAAHDFTLDGLIVGLVIRTGASDAVTIQQVSSHASNI